jgi:hypothetical protein
MEMAIDVRSVQPPSRCFMINAQLSIDSTQAAFATVAKSHQSTVWVSSTTRYPNALDKADGIGNPMHHDPAGKINTLLFESAKSSGT